METTQTAAPGLSYSSRPNVRPANRINVRLILFLVIACAPFLAAFYFYFNSTMARGIQHVGDVDRVDLKALGYFPFDQSAGTINEVPKKWRDLDGKRIELTGYMYSPQSAGNQLDDFQFVYNIQKCCFSGPPQVQERVFAHVARGRTVPYYDSFCKITGILHVDVKKVDGVIISIYTLDVDNAGAEG